MENDQVEFLRHFAADESLRADPAACLRHEQLTARSSVCSYCGVGCSYTVQADTKGIDQLTALSPLGLCVKGKTSLLTGGDSERRDRLGRRGIPDDRIRVPMLRGHDGRMHEVSWEEALDRAAWLFLHAREWVSPESVAIYGNGQKTMEAIWMASLYKLVFRMPTVGANSEHCLASAGAAHELNFGNEASFTWKEFDELLDCDVAVLHGTNPLITFPQAYEKLKRNARAVKVVIDPVRTDTVSDLQAIDPRTIHIRFRQGGDVMLNLAVSRVILEEGWQDAEYLARAVSPESIDAFRELCMQDRCSPEEVAERIALDGEAVELAATIRRYAALIAKPMPDGERPRAAFVSSMGINQSTGSYGFSTNLNLLLLTGNVGRRGAGSMRIAGQSNATSELMLGFNSRRLVFNLDPDNAEHRAALARVLDLPERNIPEMKGTSVARMSEDDRLYCFLFMGTQMTRNMPRLGHWMRRMGRAFNVIMDPFLADGVLEFADVLLPALTYTERTGVIQRGDRTLQLQQRVTEPPPLAWSDEQILVRLALAIARRLRDPDTAAMNDLDPDVVERTFSRYLDADGNVDSAKVFDHMVAVSRDLNLYCRMEDADGTPVSHDLLRERAGMGVQWQGNGRYAEAREDGHAADIFPRLHHGDTERAKLVRPPDAFMAELEKELEPGTLSLISGRGRPGKQPLQYVARYNSGIKTLPITGRSKSRYEIELHPQEAARHGLRDGQAARMTSHHGAVLGTVSFNDRIPSGAAFVDFVPAEINRLTDYLDADRFTKQSLIKRTPVRLQALTGGEAILWDRPDAGALHDAIGLLHANFRETYPTDEDWLKLQRGEPGAVVWLPPQLLREPGSPAERALAEATGAMTAFIQRYVSDTTYRAGGAALLRALDESRRSQFLIVLLPLLRRLDYQSALHTLLADIVDGVDLIDEQGQPVHLDMLSAHRSAVLEFKEEIVAIQLYLAARRGLDLLFGPGAVVRREDLAFVSGIAIPCAGDVPAHFLGMSPSDLSSDRMIHSRAIGSSALMVIDRRTRRAVRIDVTTGVLPFDGELTKLRGIVINRKRGATGKEHARFFDRLGELVVDYVRTGDENFKLFGPVPFDWEEYSRKFAIAPAARADFFQYLLKQRTSPGLASSLVGLGILDRTKQADVLARIDDMAAGGEAPEVLVGGLTEAEFDAQPLRERVMHVVETIIQPILKNDGGRVEILDIDEASGALSIRFVGSCANCPYSLLSMEQLVKPSLLAIKGVTAVSHRARMAQYELERAREEQPAKLEFLSIQGVGKKPSDPTLFKETELPMFFKEWDILIVDDEPDVLQVSKLAMRHFEVYGLPVKLHTASSKADAIKAFASAPGGMPSIAVAFIDVVMESDTAGLDLCKSLREEHGNRVTQLFVRTGQPGMAPERTVLDRYDINGYFTKAEATEDKLYSLVKSGVRQYLWNIASLGTSLILNNAVAAGDSRDAIKDAVMKTFKGFHFVDGAPVESRAIQCGVFVGSQLLGATGLEPKEAEALRQKLSDVKSKPLSADGDSYTQDGNGLMVNVPGGPLPGGISFVAQTTFAPPESVMVLYHRALKSVATLAMRARA